MEHAREKYEVSERHACRLLGQWRRTQRYAAIQRIDEEALTEAIASGKPTLINAVIDEAAGTESGRLTNLNPQSAAKKK